MTPAVFVDTSALYALFAGSDEHHAAARGYLPVAQREGVPLLTTATVLMEGYVLAHARLGQRGLLRFRGTIARTAWIDVRGVSPTQEEQAWRMLESHADKNWSFVDATSFVVMRALKLRRAFTFDTDFAQAGFEMLPAVATE